MNKEKLKIILLVNNFLPTIGGKQFVVYYLALSLQKLGHDVRVVGPSTSIRTKKIKFPFPVHRYTDFGIGKLNKKYKNNKLLKKLYEIIRLILLKIDVSIYGCDVINAHITYPSGYLAVKLSENMNIPVVITPHGEDIQVIPELDYGLRLNAELNKCIKYALNGAFAITAISNNVYKALLDAKAKKEKIVKIQNGVDVSRFSEPIDIDVRKYLGVPQDARLIVTVGQFHPRKGHDILIKAMQNIIKHERRTRLVIIGNSDESLVRLVDELNLNECVVLTGPIKSPFLAPESDQGDVLAAILQNCDIYMSAGIDDDSEGLSLAVLEAMAASVPVVASDISGNRDIVVQDKNGLLVAPGDVDSMSEAIVKILSNDDMQNKMRIAAQRTASSYDWEEIAKEYLSVYRKADARYREDSKSAS